MNKVVSTAIVCGCIGLFVTVAICWLSPVLAKYRSPPSVIIITTNNGTRLPLLVWKRFGSELIMMLYTEEYLRDHSATIRELHASQMLEWSSLRRGDIAAPISVLQGPDGSSSGVQRFAGSGILYDEGFGYPFVAMKASALSKAGIPNGFQGGKWISSSIWNDERASLLPGGGFVSAISRGPGWLFGYSLCVAGFVCNIIIWTCVAACSRLLVVQSMRIARWHRVRHHKCASCNYDMSGLVSSVCPECGKVRSEEGHGRSSAGR